MASGNTQDGTNYVYSPGRMLDEHLKVQGASAAELARRCDCSPELIGKVLREQASLDARTAILLERVLGVDASLWLSIEANFQLQRARRSLMAEQAKHARWMEQFPTDELVRRNRFDKPASKEEEVSRLLAFFGLASVELLKERFSSISGKSVAYRNLGAFKGSKANLLTWLRLGELEAEQQWAVDYSRDKFKQAIPNIRKVASQFLEIERALELATELCNDAGVSLAVVRPLPKTSPNGAAWWMTPKRPVIMLGTHHDSADSLWFTFFHEAAHILLHGRRNVFVDVDEGAVDEMESQANAWAQNALIPRRDWVEFVRAERFDERSVRAFARKQGVAPGFVAGRLLYDNRHPSPELEKLSSLRVMLSREEMSDLSIEYA